MMPMVKWFFGRGWASVSKMAVAAAHDDRFRDEGGRAVGARLSERGDYVLIQRLAERTRFLGAVHDRDRPNRVRQLAQERRDRERPKQVHLQDPDLLATHDERVDRLVHGLCARSHDHDDPLRLGMPRVLEQAVVPACARGESRHQPLDDLGARAIEEVRGFARLEERIGVLRSPSQHGMVGREAPSAVGRHLVFGQQRSQVFVRERFNFRDLVRRPEAVEEVHEWHTGLERRRVRDRGKVLCLLHGRGAEHCEAGGAACHNVGVVAENGQGVRGDGPRCDMHRERGQLARDLEHVGDHQEQSLRRRKGRRQRSGLQRAVHRSGGARLRLHLDDVRDVAPEVQSAMARPFVGELAHRRRGCNRINRDHVAYAVCDRRCCFVAVHRYRSPLGHICLHRIWA
jgi:hypothetical protein